MLMSLREFGWKIHHHTRSGSQRCDLFGMWTLLSLSIDILRHHCSSEIVKRVLLLIYCLHSSTICSLIHYNWFMPHILLKLVRLSLSVIPLIATLKVLLPFILPDVLGNILICGWLEPWNVHSLRIHVTLCAYLFGLVQLRPLCPWGFSRQEYWSGLLCASPGNFPNPGTETRSPALQAESNRLTPMSPNHQIILLLLS